MDWDTSHHTQQPQTNDALSTRKHESGASMAVSFESSHPMLHAPHAPFFAHAPEYPEPHQAIAHCQHHHCPHHHHHHHHHDHRHGESISRVSSCGSWCGHCAGASLPDPFTKDENFGGMQDFSDPLPTDNFSTPTHPDSTHSTSFGDVGVASFTGMQGKVHPQTANPGLPVTPSLGGTQSSSAISQSDARAYMSAGLQISCSPWDLTGITQVQSAQRTPSAAAQAPHGQPQHSSAAAGQREVPTDVPMQFQGQWGQPHQAPAASGLWPFAPPSQFQPEQPTAQPGGAGGAQFSSMQSPCSVGIGAHGGAFSAWQHRAPEDTSFLSATHAPFDFAAARRPEASETPSLRSSSAESPSAAAAGPQPPSRSGSAHASHATPTHEPASATSAGGAGGAGAARPRATAGAAAKSVEGAGRSHSEGGGKRRGDKDKGKGGGGEGDEKAQKEGASKPRLIRKPSYWTKEEHQQFLFALEKFGYQKVASENTDHAPVGLGPGMAELISAFMGTRTVAQVRSHAQKHFIRQWKDGK